MLRKETMESYKMLSKTHKRQKKSGRQKKNGQGPQIENNKKYGSD